MTRASSITLTQEDVRRLAAIVDGFEGIDDRARSKLQDELDRAEVVASTAVSPRVVTMNSRVLCRDERGGKREVELVYPWHADIARGRISVLAPLGCALIGAAVGDAVEVVGHGKPRRWWVEAVHYQPEAAGEYAL